MVGAPVIANKPYTRAITNVNEAPHARRRRHALGMEGTETTPVTDASNW